MADYTVPDPKTGKPIPGYNRATPGFSGALLDIMKALFGAPGSGGQARQGHYDQIINQQSGEPPTNLGNQF